MCKVRKTLEDWPSLIENSRFFKEQTDDLPLTIPSLGTINVGIKTNHKPMTTLGH